VKQIKTILIGDIHGCDAELEALLGRWYVPGDRVIALGDMIDRGPNSARFLDLLIEIGAEAVLGNHEDKHLRYVENERRRPVGDSDWMNPMPLVPHHHVTRGQLRPEHWAWLERLPPWIELREHGVLAVHGGFLAGRPWREQPARKVCRVQITRPGDDKTPFANWQAGGTEVRPRPSLVEAGYRHWADFWQAPPIVAYGHATHPRPVWSVRTATGTVHRYGEARPPDELVAVGLDTGCCHGGRLTALVLPAWDVMSVSAARDYHAESRQVARAHVPAVD
jgi:bis(5'-nucleosyl)-tetraphosphatase (symmetrical)